MLIDTHCHLSYEDYDNLEEIIKNMDGIMIASGCNDKTNKEVLELESAEFQYKMLASCFGEFRLNSSPASSNTFFSSISCSILYFSLSAERISLSILNPTFSIKNNTFYKNIIV